MRRFYIGRIYRRTYSTAKSHAPIIHIENGTFYRNRPTTSSFSPELFPSLDLSIPSNSTPNQNWAIIGPSSAGKTTLLQLLRNKHICIPASARSYPYLTDANLTPERAIKQVGFDGEQGIYSQAPKSAYLSARYESRREADDFSVRDYLRGDTELNPFKAQDNQQRLIDQVTWDKLLEDLNLVSLIDMPVSNLSNGQTRRARIAKALLEKPEILLLDEPFMGLDPPTLLTLSPMLKRLADERAPRLVLALRPQDPIPEWITHLMWLKGSCRVKWQGRKDEVLEKLREYIKVVKRGEEEDNEMEKFNPGEIGRKLTESGIQESKLILPSNSTAVSEVPLSRDGHRLHDSISPEFGEPLVEMVGARVAYGEKVVLGNWTHNDESGKDRQGLWWTVRRGERWGVFGPNGSGKTTLLSLICSDHPQTYSLPIKLFGRSRLPEPGKPGISIFDIQSRIGHSSPEIHNHIPRSLTLRQVLENAWSDTFKGLPKLDDSAAKKIDACLRWFKRDLAAEAVNPESITTQHNEESLGVKWTDKLIFGELPFSAQRVALFLRAIVKHPDLVILDEAFSGMDDGVRNRCQLFLAHGETKRFSYDETSEQKTNAGLGPKIVSSEQVASNTVVMGGMKPQQALICISHVREEIPGSVREWICLPEANTGEPARFGRLNGPLEGDEGRWNEIWGMG